MVEEEVKPKKVWKRLGFVDRLQDRGSRGWVLEVRDHELVSLVLLSDK